MLEQHVWLFHEENLVWFTRTKPIRLDGVVVNQLGCRGTLNSRIPPQATLSACLTRLASVTSHLLTDWQFGPSLLFLYEPRLHGGRGAERAAAPPKKIRHNKNHQFIKKFELVMFPPLFNGKLRVHSICCRRVVWLLMFIILPAIWSPHRRSEFLSCNRQILVFAGFSTESK